MEENKNLAYQPFLKEIISKKEHQKFREIEYDRQLKEFAINHQPNKFEIHPKSEGKAERDIEIDGAHGSKK